MTARVLRPAITLTTVTAVLLAALAVYAFLTAGTSHADSTYNPTTTGKYCNAMSAAFPDADIAGNPSCTENLQTGVAADYFTTLNMVSGDLNFSAVVTFAPGTTSITDGNTLTEGAKVGGLSSTSTLGTANGACNSTVPVDFVFYNVDLPDNMADPRASTNIAFARPEGSTDRFGGWQVGSPPAPAGGTAPGAPPRATGASIAITNYPSHLLDLFDPDFIPGVSDGPADPIVPQAVYGGLTQVVGTWQMLYFAQFEATGSRSMAGLPSPFTLMDPDMGKPSVSVLNDTTAVQASPSSITDFCTPLSVTTMLRGTTPAADGAQTRSLSPTLAATNFIVQYNASLRDTDQDSYENALDSCQTAVDASYNPRVTGASAGDSDGDGLANSCDPNDASGILDPNFNDHDLDLFQNRQDNCGAVANNGQEDSDIGSGAAADDGPHTDTIGDACDSEAGTISVVQNRSSGAATVSITMSDTIPNGRYHVKTNFVPKCFGATPAGGTDADADGYCAAQDSGGDSGGCTSTVPPTCTVRHTAWAGATHPLLQADTDSDLFSDAVENYLGTDGTKSCAMTPVPPSTAGGVNDETLDNWPMDFNDNRLADIIDVSTYSSRFNLFVNQAPATPRWDLTANGLVDILDVSRFSTVFNQRCGTAGFPPAFAQQ